MILERLVAQRKRCKVEMEACTDDPLKYYLLDCRQNAIKITCNSIYGALGCMFSLLPLSDIAKTVTYLGRLHIHQVKAITEATFTTANGYESNAEVVGGDTDSAFVKMPVPSALREVEADAVAEAFRMAEILAKAVNDTLKSRKPMKLEVEKVYSRLLLMLKKHYAGLKYKEGEADKPPSVDIKGCECVRRDGCPLIRKLVREVLEQLVSSGDVEGAGAVVREKVQGVMTNTLPMDDYVIRKTLRKDPMACMEPLTQKELCLIRSVAFDKSANASVQPQLSYSELDQAIRKGMVGKGSRSLVNLRWKQRLPQVSVAWKQRLVDPGSAPVPGLPVQYVVTLNGGVSVCSKSEALETVLQQHLQVDRKHYQDKLKTAMEGIFCPIYERVLSQQQRQHKPGGFTASAASSSPQQLEQKERAGSKRKMEMPKAGAVAAVSLEERALKAVREMLWRDIKANKLRPSKEMAQAAVRESAIFKAFQHAGSKAAEAKD